MTDPVVNPAAPPMPPVPGTVAPLTVPPVVAPIPPTPPPAPTPPVAPAKPKPAFVVVTPKETPVGATVPPKKSAAKTPTPEEIKDAEADQIKSAGVLTVVVVTTKGSALTSNWNAVFLPKDAPDLSEVEVHRDPASTGMDVAVYPNEGEAIGTNPVNDGSNDVKTSVGVNSSKATSFRKLSKALWAVIS
jgi:hypothetical protein